MSRPIEADFSQQWVFPPSFDDLLPRDHPARFIRDFVDELDLRDLGIKIPRTTAAGAPAFSPRLLLRVWLYGWFVRVRTHRKLEDACRNQLPLVWLTGMNYPDHNTLWRFWRDNKKALKSLFRASVQVAANMGLVSMVFHAVDGTKIRPASSPLSALHEEDLENLLRMTDEAVEQMDKEIAEEGGGGCSVLPDELLDLQTRRRRIAEELEALRQAGVRHMLPAEPEVRMIKAAGGIAFNLNAQATADSACGIVVAEDVATDVTDAAQLVPMLRQAEENLDARPVTTAADGGYSDQEQIAEADKGGWEVTVPVGDRGELENALHSHHFGYDAGDDCLVCPLTAQKLAFSTVRKAREGHLEAKVYRCPVTQTCPFRGACTQNKRGREIEITACRESVVCQARKHEDGRMTEAMHRRLATVEPVFAWIKEHWGFRRFSVRGIENVRAQWSLVCTISNLRRIYDAWRRKVNCPGTGKRGFARSRSGPKRALTPSKSARSGNFVPLYV